MRAPSYGWDGAAVMCALVCQQAQAHPAANSGALQLMLTRTIGYSLCRGGCACFFTHHMHSRVRQHTNTHEKCSWNRYATLGLPYNINQARWSYLRFVLVHQGVGCLRNLPSRNALNLLLSRFFFIYFYVTMSRLSTVPFFAFGFMLTRTRKSSTRGPPWCTSGTRLLLLLLLLQARALPRPTARRALTKGTSREGWSTSRQVRPVTVHMDSRRYTQEGSSRLKTAGDTTA